MPFDRNTMKLDNAYRTGVEDKDAGGMRGPTILDVPAGTKFYKLDLAKAGQDHYINILPWGIETEKHPNVVRGKAKIGEDADYYLDVYTHRVDGALKGQTLCLSRMYGRPCPYEQAMQANGGDDTKAPQRRSIFWVQECDRTGRPVGDPAPKLFMVTHNNFTKTLMEEADIQGKSMGLQMPVPFANPGTDGFVVGFRFRAEMAGGGVKYAEVNRVDFYPRTVPVSQAILNELPALDRLLVIPTVDGITKAIFGDAAATSTTASDQEPEF